MRVITLTKSVAVCDAASILLSKELDMDVRCSPEGKIWQKIEEPHYDEMHVGQWSIKNDRILGWITEDVEDELLVG